MLKIKPENTPKWGGRLPLTTFASGSQVLISACLLGEAVRYDGGDCRHYLDHKAKKLIQDWQKQGLLLPMCPEVVGGLSVPRPAL